MASGQLQPVLRRLRQLVGGPADELSDQDLLERFAAQHDETDFEVLMRRHGPLVLGVCRRTLGHEQEAEDVFQATFLVLARKAGSIRKPASLGSWLHGVAYRLALKARAAAARRRTHERRCGAMSAANGSVQPGWDDVRPVLDEELQHLPEKYRAPLILCYLEGKTHAEAAAVLGWPLGSMSKRLARAQKQLRARLERRGIVLSAAVLGTLTAGVARAAVPAPLFQASLKAAMLAATGQATAGAVSPAVLTLMNGGLRTMFYARLCRIGVIVLTGVLLASGLGLMAGQLTLKQDPNRTQDQAPDEQNEKAENQAGLGLVPADALGFVHINFHDIWSMPAFKELRERAGKDLPEFVRDFRKNVGVSANDIQDVTVAVLGLEDRTGDPALVVAITTNQAYDHERVLNAFIGEHPEARQEGRKTYYAVANANQSPALYLPNDHTIVSGPQAAVRQYLSLGKPTKEGPLASALQTAAGKHAVVAAFHVSTPLRVMLSDALRRNGLPAEMRFLAPLQNTRGGTAVVDLNDKNARLDVTLRYADTNDADEARDALKVGLTMLRRALATAVPTGAKHDPHVEALLDDMMKSLRTAQVSREKSTVTVRLQGNATPLVAAALPMLRRTQLSQTRIQSANNLKQMMLAMHNYADTYRGHFPAHAIYSKDGKPLLSWRVAILPWIEQDAVYRQFHLDEPWNSEHNKRLLAQMPPIYQVPGRSAKRGETFYQVFVGKNTMFPPGKHGVGFPNITDGTSNTIAIVEARDAVPWTKPEDLSYSADAALPALGGASADGFNAAIADGSVHWLRKGLNEQTLRDLITINDGHQIDWSTVEPTSHGYGLQSPAGVRTATPTVAPPKPPLGR